MWHQQQGQQQEQSGFLNKKKRKQQQQQQQQHPHHQQRATVAAAAAGLVSLYAGARGALRVWRALRRRCLRRLLCVVGPALAAAGVDYYVDFGSLLGAVREGDVIAYDNDADVVALNPDWDDLLPALRAALPPAFKAYFVTPSEDPSIRWLRVLYRVGVLDIYGGYYSSPRGGSSVSINNNSNSSGGGGGGGGMSTAAGECSCSCGANGGCHSSGSNGGGNGGGNNNGGADRNNDGHETGGGGGGSGGHRCACGRNSSSGGAAGATIAIPQGHGDLCDVPAALVLPLRPLQFRGVALSGPADAHGVLEHRYGPTYMVPRYMCKGRDAVEQAKFYARLLTLLDRFGVRV